MWAVVQLVAIHSYSSLCVQAQEEHCSLLAYSSEDTHSIMLYKCILSCYTYIHNWAHKQRLTKLICVDILMQVTLKESNKEEITYSKCILIFFFYGNTNISRIAIVLWKKNALMHLKLLFIFTYHITNKQIEINVKQRMKSKEIC